MTVSVPDGEQGQSIVEVAQGLVAEAERLVARLQAFLQEGGSDGVWTSGLRDRHIQSTCGVDNAERLVKKIVSERHFLKGLLDDATGNADKKIVARVLSSNMAVYRGVAEVLTTGLEGVTAVQKIFSTADRRTNVEVDIVSGNGSNWVKVKGTSSRTLRASLEGTAKFGERNILELAEDMAHVASQNEINFGVPNCFIVFTSRIDADVKRRVMQKSSVTILEMGELHHINSHVHTCLRLKAERELAEELGEGMDSDEEDFAGGIGGASPDGAEWARLHPSIDPLYVQRVNLDITALFALTSDLTNGNNCYDFPSHKVLDQQARDDRATPVLPMLRKYLYEEEKYIIACKTVVAEFRSIVSQVAGEEEKGRAAALLESINIVPDTPSPRTLTLVESGRVKTRQKVIFGTGESYQAITVTANVQFVQAAADQGVPLAVFVHPARALTEQKRQKGAVYVGE
eukprot:TRINITY_DN28617_c0_g1_i1.p1 TRINITY_DN28617_c0_g1~~TRINITY_DN28617_c0_g1_i1.p1  ORF type:complete len:458 (+),score=139.27 TRINITY_DN28617_c0_g1_i1:172-1545(+)